MSMVPSAFFGNRSIVYDPFSLDVWDPLKGRFPTNTSLSSARQGWDPDAATAFTNARLYWKETPESHVFHVDLPGAKKEDVKVEVEDGRILQISGQRSREEEEKSDTWHLVERSSGSFLRRFQLPEDAKVDQVRASMEHGVLSVTIPREAAIMRKPEVKAIEISGW